MGGEKINMKKKESTILCIMILTVFLMPLMGNSVLSEGRGEKIYYFNSYSPFEAWETNPGYMADGNEGTFASTTINGDVERLTSNTCSEDVGSITKVEIRAKGCYARNPVYLVLRPVFPGGDGDDHTFLPPECPNAAWSDWFDITNDPNAPDPWTSDDVVDLDCDVEARLGTTDWPFELYCSKVEIRVTFGQ